MQGYYEIPERVLERIDALVQGYCGLSGSTCSPEHTLQRALQIGLAALEAELADMEALSRRLDRVGEAQLVLQADIDAVSSLLRAASPEELADLPRRLQENNDAQ